ncbi:PCNT protein, partial [Probosciger aterrimus]|nr:PCNT protein [Probosciger aterrimus]
TASGAGTKVLDEQQPPAMSSPPTRDTGLHPRTSSTRLGTPCPRASHCLPCRLHPSTRSGSEKSLVPTEDPERSPMVYIYRLEVIQQRLGGMHPGESNLSP